MSTLPDPETGIWIILMTTLVLSAILLALIDTL